MLSPEAARVVQSTVASNAISGETNNGTLTLDEGAQGGLGGNASSGTGGAGGAATGNLAFNDTQNADQSASIAVNERHWRQRRRRHLRGGNGGNAAANVAITGSGAVTVNLTASGGSGGSGTTAVSTGSVTVQAAGTTSGVSNLASVHASGTGSWDHFGRSHFDRAGRQSGDGGFRHSQRRRIRPKYRGSFSSIGGASQGVPTNIDASARDYHG